MTQLKLGSDQFPQIIIYRTFLKLNMYLIIFVVVLSDPHDTNRNITNFNIFWNGNWWSYSTFHMNEISHS